MKDPFILVYDMKHDITGPHTSFTSTFQQKKQPLDKASQAVNVSTNMTLPILAKKVKKLATFQLFNLKLLLNGESSRGFSKFKKTYKLKGELGRGGFGIVYRAVRILDDLPVAVKFIDRRSVREWGKINDEQVPMEVCMLAKCSKVKGVIRLLDWYSIPEGYLIVMERPYPCVDMFDFIKGQQKLDEDMARFLFQQVVQTIYECSQKKVLHRDLKDENIVIDLVTGETKLIDFGASTILKKSHYTDFQGTRLYCPPEWFLHSLYLGKEAAVWSLGVLLYNAINGRLPFRNEKDICTAHLLGPVPFFTQVSSEVRDLISRCLAFDPFVRCSLEDILRHPWMQMNTPNWNQLNQIKRKDKEDEKKEHSEELEELSDDSDRKNHDLEKAESSRQTVSHYQTSEGESGVGSSASSMNSKMGAMSKPAKTPQRFSKTSLIVPPSSSELKAVVQPSKTKSVTNGPAVNHLNNQRRRRENPQQHSTVLTALRRAMSRETMRKQVENTPKC